MCFSATASFSTAAALTPVGLLAVRLARRRPEPERWLPLAALPLLFALQQTFEGLVWLGLGRGAAPASLRLVALAYLAMAYALWPVWIPWSALRLCGAGCAPWRRRLIRGLAGLGLVLAGLLWLPLLWDPGRITPVQRLGSIDYQAIVPGSAQVSHLLVSLIYGALIVLPLLLAPQRRLWLLAAALALAFAAAQLAYLHAFSSVWCYFSAVLSVLVVWILAARPAPSPITP